MIMLEMPRVATWVEALISGPAPSVSLGGCSGAVVNHSARRWELKFRLACPNVKFRGTGSESGADDKAKHPALVKFESVGFIFRPDGSGFSSCKTVVEKELETMAELMELQEKTGVLITIDGQTLIFDAP
jgi:hypothetical protein